MKLRTKVILGSIAAALLLGPFLVPVNTSGTMTNREAAAELWGGRSEFVEILDHEVHLVTAGDENSDRLILLLHGFGASAFSYKEVLGQSNAGVTIYFGLLSVLMVNKD